MFKKKLRVTENGWWQKIAKNQFLIGSALVFLCILLGRVTQFVKELFVAKEIGISAELDAFIMALLILTVSLEFLFKPFGYALIPIIARVRKFSLEKVNLLFTKVLLISLGIGLIIGILQLFFIDNLLPILVGNFDATQQALTKDILFQLTPFYVFDIVGFLFGVYLNAQNKNLLYSIYPAFPALFTIIYFLFIPLDQPIYQQVYGFNFGSFVILCILAYTCFKNGYRPRLNFKIDRPLKVCFNQWFPLILSALLISINPMIDKKMATDLGIGSLSHLEYGVKVFSIFTSFAVTGISTVLFPFYSEKVAQKDFKGIVNFLKTTLKIIILPLVLGTALFVFFSEDFIQLLFERGAFSASDTKVVAGIMDFYMISFPIMTIGIIGVRLINALQLNKYVLYYSFVNLVLNISLNILLIQYMGLKGIALSSSIVYTVNAVLMWTTIVWYFRKKNYLKTV